MLMDTMLKKKISDPKWAFTLIEMLVVIFVLWVGILSIVVLISRNISLTKDVHMRNTATLLAREWIELIYNYKSTNELLWYERNCAQRQGGLAALSNTQWNNNSNCNKYFWTWDGGDYRFTIEWANLNYSQVTMKPLIQSTKIPNWTHQLSTFDDLREWSKIYITNIANNTTQRQSNRISSNINNQQVNTIFTVTGYTHQSWEQTNYARYITFTGMNSLPKDSPISNNDIHHISSTVLFKTPSQTGQVVLESFISNSL